MIEKIMGVLKAKGLKGIVKEDLTPAALILLGGGVIIDGYNTFGTTRLGLMQMAVGGIVVLAGVGWYYVQKELKALKK